jgi:hypothetical protein
MKLNLLPTYVGKANTAKVMTVVSVLVALAGCAAAVGMIFVSNNNLRQARQEAEELIPQHQQVVALAKSADTIMNTARPIILNINLAEAMQKHSTVYPDLYDEVRRYIPGFFRVTNMDATPNGPDTCTVEIQGVLQTQQQYADLMLALLRIPGAQGVTRSGYQPVNKIIPNLVEEDQVGLPILRGEDNIPSDPQARLEYMIGQGSVSGFDSTGNFGLVDEPTREAMPNWSLVTVTVVLPRAIQTPDPRATLSGAAALIGSTGTPAPSPTPGPAPTPTSGRPEGQRGPEDE